MKLLVLGGTGMLGHKVAQMAAGSGEWDVHATVRRTVPTVLHFPDVTYHEGVGVSSESSAVEELLDSLRPDVIINAIGVVKQSGAIGDVKQTLWINGMLPHLLTVANPNPDGRVIQISTDCVFKGDQGNYPRSLAPDARDLYGRSKQVGELLQAPHLTLRTSIVGFEFGEGTGLLSWLLTQQGEIRGYRKAIFSGLPTAVLARTIFDLIRSPQPLSGVWHVASDPIDKFDLTSRVNEALDLGLDIVADDAVQIDRSLDDSEFRSATGTHRPGWDELVEALVSDYRTLPYAEHYSKVRNSP